MSFHLSDCMDKVSTVRLRLFELFTVYKNVQKAQTMYKKYRHLCYFYKVKHLLSLTVKMCRISQVCVHTNTRASTCQFTPKQDIVGVLLWCSCWFRLPLPVVEGKPAVTFTLALQICSEQQNRFASLFHTYSIYLKNTPSYAYTWSFSLP